MAKTGKKRALITGVTGQDGAYLAKFLLEKGYQVFGTFRRLSTPNFWRIQYLNIFDKISLIPVELIDTASITEAIISSKPDEIYNLAAQSFVGASFEQPVGTADVSGVAVPRILEVIRQVNPKIKFYQASTSELYGNHGKTVLNESSPFRPVSPYAAAKIYGYWITRIYREGYGIFAVNGILFNHESPLRGLEFVTRKITNSVAKIAIGLEKNLMLGNLTARRDWGYAPDYVQSMWLMLQHTTADDYVVATNESHSVEEFVQEAFEAVGLNWKKYVKTDKRFMRPIDVNLLQGDFSKAKRKLGWKPEIRFNKLVRLMVQEDLERWQRWQKGEIFPWDALNYPNEMNLLTRAMRM
ncbi:MAG: GDP-mannose 4,6-dehydratase [Deltaproteobacteria bacterium RBG_13_43_22]|nr:MAG: GDP-mannose 4,6-dehydratase [Deltaproteobacteria bacterium RBG_13_43_22]